MRIARTVAEAQLDVMRCRQARCRVNEAKQNEASQIWDDVLGERFIMYYLLKGRWSQPSGSPSPSLNDLPEETINRYRDRALARRRRTFAQEMAAIERYERRALSRRNRAIQDLDCQRILEAVENKKIESPGDYSG